MKTFMVLFITIQKQEFLSVNIECSYILYKQFIVEL